MTGPSPTDSTGQIQAELSRDLGLVSALAIGVGTMIAAGIFTLSGLAIGYVGSAAIAAFLLAALVASFTALTGSPRNPQSQIPVPRADRD